MFDIPRKLKGKYNSLSKLRKTLVLLFSLALFSNLAFSFYFILNALNINIKIIQPPLKIYFNYDNYFRPSNYSYVVNEQKVDSNVSLNVELNDTNLLVLPVFGKKGSLLTSFNVSFRISSPIKDLSNTMEVWLAKTYASSCSKYKKLGKINTTSGLRYLCGIKKFTDKNVSSEYFTTIYLPLETEDLNKSYLLVIRINPLYKGEIPLKISPKVIEYYG